MTEPWWGLRGWSPEIFFGFLTSKRHKKGLKKHSKNTIDSMTKHANSEPTLFSWLIYRLLAESNTTWSRISHPVAVVVGRLELRRDIYPCNITLVRRYTPTKHGKASLQRCSYRRNEHNGLCLFSLLIIKEWIVKAVNQNDSFKGTA